VTTSPGGGPKHVWDLVQHLPRSEFELVIGAPRDGIFFDRFRDRGLDVLHARAIRPPPVRGISVQFPAGIHDHRRPRDISRVKVSLHDEEIECHVEVAQLWGDGHHIDVGVPDVEAEPSPGELEGVASIEG